jgi:hypothetical protein
MLGHPISRAPSREDFINRNGTGAQWNPYWQVFDPSLDDPWSPEFWDFINFKCPPLPEPLNFFGP